MKKYVPSINDNGFTLTEVLVAMLVVSISCLLLMQCTLLLRNLYQPHYESEDRVAIAQLRILLAQADTLQGQGDELSFRYQGKDSYLQLHTHRMVRRSGYEIFLQDLDEVSFAKDGNCYELNWRRGKSMKKAVIACE